MTSQREQELAAQLADATQQCGAMADALRDISWWVAHGDVSEWEKFVDRIDALLAGKVPEPHITQPARVGGIVFQPGIKVSTVLDATYRAAEYEQPDGNANFDALMAAIHGRTPEGWQLVPVEPTNEMLRQARTAPIPAVLLDSMNANLDLRSEATYRAMLRSAPKPQGGEV